MATMIGTSGKQRPVVTAAIDDALGTGCRWRQEEILEIGDLGTHLGNEEAQVVADIRRYLHGSAQCGSVYSISPR